MNRFTRILHSHTAGAVVTMLACGAGVASGQAIIHNNTVKLGVDLYGQLNILGGVPSSVMGTTAVGVRFLPLGNGGPEAEATAHGCFCEGWGIKASSPPVSARANNSFGGPANLVSNSFTNTSSTAVATCSTAGGELRIVHDFRPSATPNLYEVLVTVTNTTTAPMTGIVYRRNMDWDVEQTAFSEYSTIDTYPIPGGPLPPNVLFTSEDGFVDSDPNVAPTFTSCGPLFVDCGPADHGAQFDLDLGNLGAGASTTFKIYYGAAPTEPAALAALGVVSAYFYSFGQPNLSPPDHGSPNTFIFAFGGALFTPGCTEPPDDMVAWLPFDESSGSTTDNILHPTADGSLAGPGAAFLGTIGEVGKAVCFDIGQVNIPHYTALHLNGDITIDAWVRTIPQSPPTWKYTIIDKRQFMGPVWRGYWLYLNGATGVLTLEGNDGFGASWTASGPPVPFNAWQHIAVAVKRNCVNPGDACVRFWLNGAPTPGPTIAGETGTFGTTAGVRVGDDLDPATFDNFMTGCIDELEIFNRALVDNEILKIYAARESGKCKEFCVSQPLGTFWGGQMSVTMPYQVCNHTNTPQCYTLAFLPATCSPPGVASPTGITASPSGTICVPPLSCTTVWLTIPRPSFVSIGDVSCFTICMTNTQSGEISCCDSQVIWREAVLDISWPPTDVVVVIDTSGIDFGPVGVGPRGPRPFRGGVRIRAIAPDGEPDVTAISLNGLPPGEPWIEVLNLKPGTPPHEIPLTLAILADNPGKIYRIVLEADLDGDGEFEPLEVRSVVGRLSGEECEPAADENFEFHPPGTVCGLQGFIPWQNGVDVCGEVSTEQASSGMRSLKIVGATGGSSGLGDDTVLPVAGVESGEWTLSVMTYVPVDATGDGALVVLNTYDDTSPPTPSWYSAQVLFRAGLGTVQADIGAGTTTLIKGQWVEFRIEVDLGADSANYFYNGVEFVHGRPWTDGVVPGSPGPARLQALDFYGGEPSAGGTSGMYFDDVRIAPVCTTGEGGGADCNKNGVDDATDIAKGTSRDCYNAAKGVGGRPDGIPDECQCVADWNLDGTVNSTDVSDFINTFFADQAAGTATGDINCDGVSNSTDVSDFINLWFSAQGGQLPFAGCTI